MITTDCLQLGIIWFRVIARCENGCGAELFGRVGLVMSFAEISMLATGFSGAVIILCGGNFGVLGKDRMVRPAAHHASRNNGAGHAAHNRGRLCDGSSIRRPDDSR